jgi:hypothetical protein
MKTFGNKKDFCQQCGICMTRNFVIFTGHLVSLKCLNLGAFDRFRLRLGQEERGIHAESEED